MAPRYHKRRGAASGRRRRNGWQARPDAIRFVDAWRHPLMIRVQQAPFDLAAEIRAMTAGNTAIGGIVSFVGTVRDMSGDRPVEAMTLEHYPGMTEKALAEIEAEANRRWPLEASLIVHRIGRMVPGEEIVLVVAASAHR